ncbi:MAG: M50 family metallopeptidase [Mobilitalea sp.]
MSLPCINPNLEIYFEANGKISVFNKKSLKTYMVGKNEYNVLKDLDGIKTIVDISKNSRIYSELEISYLINQFEKLGFIKGKDIKAKRNLIKIKKSLINGNRIINPKNVIWKIVSFILIYLSIPILVMGIITNLSDFNQIVVTLENNLFTPSALLLVPITLFVLSLHELGHAVIARCFNVNVPEIGIMLYWFMPCAYTNLSGITFLEQRSKRILSLFAGILVNVLLMGIGLLLLNVVTGNIYNFSLWFSLSNLSIIFVNLMVFLKLDGYFLLEELLSLKGLRKKSFQYVKNNILSIVAKTRPVGGSKPKYSGVRLESDQSSLDHIVFFFYVLFSCLYIPLILLSVGISVFDFILR